MLKNKNVLLTGATGGLGSALSKMFVDAGSNLFLVGRSSKKLKALQQQLTVNLKDQQTIKIIPADLAIIQDIQNIEQQLLEASAGIDILINNAAIQGPIGKSWENDWDAWQQTLQINLMAPIALMRALIPNMIKKNYGKIINLSGGGATNARPNFTAYSTAKTGLVRFSENLAVEIKSFHIDVNCIAPGVMNTELLSEIIKVGKAHAGNQEYDVAEKNMSSKNSMQAAVELCRFLASPESNGISGKLISAVWDPWKKFADYKKELIETDIYTIRRIVPRERNMTWGDV